MKKLLLFLAGVLALTACQSPKSPETIVWDAENYPTVIEILGTPRIVETPVGKAVYFDGSSGVFLDRNPLAGLEKLTMEVVFRPDGDGEFAQRYLHLGEVGGERIMFETRVNPDSTWYADAYVRLPSGGDLVLIDSTKLHPTDRWYHMALTIDGQKATCYVDGVEQGSGALAYEPVNQGVASVGVRQNRVNYFKGTMLKLRITPRVLDPEEFLKEYETLNLQ